MKEKFIYISLTMINKSTLSKELNYLYGIFDTPSLKPTNHSSGKKPKCLSQRIRWCGYKTLGTIVIYSTLSKYIKLQQF